MSSALRIAAFAGCAALLPAGSAHAQAWVGMQNDLSLTLDYNFSWSDYIVSAGEARNDFKSVEEKIHNQSFILGGEYTILDNWAVNASVPIVSSRYLGDGSVLQLHGRYDDGSYHTVLQDFGLRTRYQVLDTMLGMSANLAFSPHIGVSVPMTEYETNGYAGAGRGLMGVDLGGSVGAFLLSGLPGLYLHGSYSYTIRERYETEIDLTSEVNQNSHQINALVGYFIGHRLEVHGAMDLRLAVDGYDYRDVESIAGRGPRPDVLLNYHDPLLAEDYLLFGGGASYNVTDTIGVSSYFRLWAWGNNTRNAHMVGLGVNWKPL